MKKILDYQTSEVVQAFNDVNLWSAPFAKILLDNIPMNNKSTVVDLGFGTGFPLIELSQRLGENSMIYGVDIWEEAIKYVKQKIQLFGLSNIKILEQSASKIDIVDSYVDLVTSNLGVNNFEERELVYKEIYRILKVGGKLCITTNPIGTFSELYEILTSVASSMNLINSLEKINQNILHRKNEDLIKEEIENYNLHLVQCKSDSVSMRFASGLAVLDHTLLRVGFRAQWESMIEEKHQEQFFNRVILEIDKIVSQEGEFKISIPVLYLEFEKEAAK